MKPKNLYTAIIVLSLLAVSTQPALGTKYIPSDPDIGTWDEVNRIYTLNTDVSETIQIDEDNLTLDGAGHTVTGPGNGYGVDLIGRTWVTIKDLTVERFESGIVLRKNCSNNTLTGNTALNNSNPNEAGILVHSSSNNTVTGNIALNNGKGIYLWHSGNNKVTGNTASSNNFQGIALYMSSNCKLIGNTANSNISQGITLNTCDSSILTGNTASNNHTGIIIGTSCDNILTDNTANSNTHPGIYIHSNSNNNTVTGNTASSNDSGISISPYCSNNTLTGNMVSDNLYGISLWMSSDNQIYNNNFISNTWQASVAGEGSSGNIFNLDRPIGGNYWSNHTSPDADGDGFVDNPYVFTGGQDDLPWAEPDGWLCKDPQDMIQELADQVLSLNLQNGISNSLDAKLDTVLQALDDINENNDVAAVNALGAFINAVEAQSGSKIPQADADALISRAQRIIDCLGGL